MNRATIYVIRVNAHGKLANSKPCAHCTKFLKKSGVKNIYYSVDDGLIYDKIKNLTSDHISHGQRCFEIKNK